MDHGTKEPAAIAISQEEAAALEQRRQQVQELSAMIPPKSLSDLIKETEAVESISIKQIGSSPEDAPTSGIASEVSDSNDWLNHGTVVVERGRTQPGGSGKPCLVMTVQIGRTRIRRFIDPKFINATFIFWQLFAEGVEAAQQAARDMRQQAQDVRVEEGGPLHYCRLLQFEGYIHRDEQKVQKDGRTFVAKRAIPALRFVIEIPKTKKIIPCCDALPERNSVDLWAQAFSIEVTEAVRKSGGAIDQEALREELKIHVRKAINALDEFGHSEVVVPVLH